MTELGRTARPLRLAMTATVVLLALLPVVCAAAAAAERGRVQIRTLDELINPFLDLDNSLWLGGAISWMATEEEIDAYLAATDDEEAEELIEEFWRQRDPEPRFEANPLREEFERRAAEADRKYSQAGVLGRNTDRGTIYIVYGPPEEERFDLPRRRGAQPIEVWTYPDDGETGLDGRLPLRAYRFSKQADLTKFHRGVPSRTPRQLPDNRLPDDRRPPLGGNPS